MSLAETILEIADELEAEEQLSDHLPTLLRFYARQLRLLVKMEGNSPKPVLSSSHLDQNFLEKCRQEFKGKHAKITAFEENESKGYVACGGPFDGVTIQGPPYMPVGSRTQQVGAIFQLEADGLLHFISMVE